MHRALQRLLDRDAGARTLDAGLDDLARAAAELADDPELTGLHLDAEAEASFLAEAEVLVRRYFELEDPRTIRPIGLELMLETDVGGVTLRGIIDRLELDAQGALVVTDYKTGRAPTERYEHGRLGGVHFYALLCERLFGQRPARIQLLYLADPVAIICTPTDASSRAVERKVGAIWSAVERACARDDFRPRPSRLCDWCGFKALCPAFGGDPAAARQPDATAGLDAGHRAGLCADRAGGRAEGLEVLAGSVAALGPDPATGPAAGPTGARSGAATSDVGPSGAVAVGLPVGR